MSLPSLLRPLLLFFASALPLAAQEYRISGIVRSAINHTPVAGAHLTAIPRGPCAAKLSQAVGTDAASDGQFSFILPCAATWLITATAPGFPAQAYDAHETFSTGVVLTSAQPNYSIDFSLAPANDLTGYVLDEAGEPVRNAKVTLLADDTTPPHALQNTQTDDRGLYEFSELIPGTYLVGVQAQPWYATAASSLRRGSNSANPIEPELDVAYPITFNPGAPDPDSATPLILTGGVSQQADIHLTPIPSIHIRIPGGAIPLTFSRRGRPNGGSDDQRSAPAAPPIVQSSILGESGFRPTSVTTGEDGSTDLAGFAPGTYAIEPRFVRTPQGSQGSDQAQRITLSANSSRTVDFASAASPAKTEDPALLASLAGKVTLPAQSSQPGQPAGKQPAIGAMLLLLPADPAAKPIRQQSNTDGSFLFTLLPPGRYTLLAIDHGWTLNWRDPATLAPYRAHATEVILKTAATQAGTIEAQTP